MVPINIGILKNAQA